MVNHFIKKICPCCKKEFERLPSYANRVTYCSTSCSAKATYFKLSEDEKLKRAKIRGNNLRGRKSGEYKKCLECGKEFYAYPYQKEKRKYCSILCSKRIISEKTKMKLSESLKGRAVWNKNKKCPSLSGENHWMYGKIHSLESRKKISCSQRGIKLEDFSGFKDEKKSAYTLFTERLKRNIRKRDNQICMLCGIHREKLNKALDIHHINYDKTLSIPPNLIALCNSCHGKTNHNRKHWIKFFQSILKEKYEYQYNSNGEIILGSPSENKIEIGGIR